MILFGWIPCYWSECCSCCYSSYSLNCSSSSGSCFIRIFCGWSGENFAYTYAECYLFEYLVTTFPTVLPAPTHFLSSHLKRSAVRIEFCPFSLHFHVIFRRHLIHLVHKTTSEVSNKIQLMFKVSHFSASRDRTKRIERAKNGKQRSLLNTFYKFWLLNKGWKLVKWMITDTS